MKKKEEYLTRKKIREKEKSSNYNAFKEVLKVIKHFFPNLIEQLNEVKDPRNKSYITYESNIILFVRILGALMGIESMRNITERFNKDKCISNIQKLFKDNSIKELPHYDTINDYLSELEVDELKNVQHKLITRLIRMKCLNSYRYKKHWLISIDGTGVYVSDKRHCNHCLTKTYEKGTTEEHTIYFHYVLEAKLTIGDMVFNIASEFVENEENLIELSDTEFTEKKKQDCELKAFYRLANELKRQYPRLPICLLLDSLYANKEVFNICQKNNWEYMIRFKDGSIPTVAKEFNVLANYEKKETPNEKDDAYRYVNEIDYEGFKLNVVEYEETDKYNSKTKFKFITSPKFKITDRNKNEIVTVCRKRWKIENHGFKEQKVHGFELEHMFSCNYQAMKNHYMLIQIAHMIKQLFKSGIKIIKELQINLKNISRDLLEAFRTIVLTDFDMTQIQTRCQIRFVEQ